MSEPLTDPDRQSVKAFIEKYWYAPYTVIKGKLYHPHEAEGFIVRRDDRITGLVTFCNEGDDLLMMTQNSTERGAGVGSSQVLRVIEVARERGAGRVWLTTSNANLDALGFYQRMGFRIAAVYPGALDAARADRKREIPEFGPNGLPIRDEIELELVLEPYLDEAV